MGTDHSGHRQRLRQRFLDQGLDGFQDYEALELMLQFVARQQDMKPLAKSLVARFGSFKEVLDAPRDELLQADGMGPAAVTLIHLVKQAASRYLQQTSRTRFSPDTPDVLIEYCKLRLGSEPNEHFRVICLDSRFSIIDEHEVAEGIVNQALVHPRRVMELALAAKAATLVLVHNHPDGDVAPSEADKTLTRALVLAGRTMSIGIYDHIIVSRDAHFSFKANGLI